MDKRLQRGACWLARGMLLAGAALCQVGWAQGQKPVAPPPADLEPGVNTSATQPSSSDTQTMPTPTQTESAAPVQTAPRSASAVKAKPAASASAAKVAGTNPTAPKPGTPAGKAHDSIELDTTSITGNRELPKVLYIVPWKRSDLGDLLGKPMNSLVDEVLAPVDRDVFKRQNRYYDALKPDAAKDAAGTGAAPEKR